MWENYKKALEQRKDRLNNAWTELGNIAANKFVNEAKAETTSQKLVKTGNYRGSWTAGVVHKSKGTETKIRCINYAEYASHLEYGHRIVTRSGIDTGRKTQGRFVGRTAIKNTRRFISGSVRKLMRKIFA